MTDTTNVTDPIESAIDAYLEDYEMIGETEDGRDACYTPNDNDRALLKDAILGLLVDPDFTKALATLAAADGEPVAEVYTMEALVPGGVVRHHVSLLKPLPAGTKLYAAAPSDVAAQEPARFLFVAMDDDGCGHPEFCRDEEAVRDAVGRHMFFRYNPATMDADHLEQVQGTTDELIEDGFTRFEGDPGFTLYRLAPGTTPSGQEGEGA